MRTTVDINPDLLLRVRRLANAEGISFKDALNRVITRGLTRARAHSARAYELPDLQIALPADWDARIVKQILHDDDVERYRKTSQASDDA